MGKMKLVLVGNGMAGMRTLEELLKAAPDLYDITVFGDEPHPNYNRIMLSPVLAGEQNLEQIILNSHDWYAEQGITLHTGRRVTRIDRRNRVVEANDGTRADYDRIVMMTNGPAATIGEIVDVDLARPRDRLNLAENPHYHHLRGRVLEFLYQKHRKAA